METKGNIEKALLFMKKWEGTGFVNLPLDKGGPTNSGISWPCWQTAAPILGRPATVDGLKRMTDADWRWIVINLFWKPIGGDQIVNEGVAIALFDFSINCGVVPAVRGIQSCLHRMGNLGVVVDGRMGPITLEAINRANPDRLFDELAAYQRAYYDGIVRRDPPQKKWYNGWINRLNDKIFKFDPNPKTK